MPFPSFSQIPTAVGTIRIRLVDEDGVPANMKAYYEVDVLDQDGMTIQFTGSQGNLIPHLTPTQISALVNFMQAIRTKAEDEFIA